MGKALILGKIEGKRRRGQQRLRQIDGITDSVCMNLSKLQETVEVRSLTCCSPWGHKELDTRMEEWGVELVQNFNFTR